MTYKVDSHEDHKTQRSYNMANENETKEQFEQRMADEIKHFEGTSMCPCVRLERRIA